MDSSSPADPTDLRPEPPPPPSPAAAPSPLASPSVVAGDARCAGCGYNLRSLPLDGNCPECGETVAYSVLGFYLSASPPAWRRDLARGLLLVWATAAVILVAYPLAAAALGILMVITSSEWDSSRWPLVVVTFILELAAILLIIRGLRLLTRPDPTVRRRPEGRSARRVLRFLAPFLLLGPLFHLVSLVGTAHVGFGALPVSSVLQGLVGSVLTDALLLVAALALLRHTGRLMERIPRPGLARFAQIEFWGLLVSGTLTVATYAFVFASLAPYMSALARWTPPPATTAPALGSPGSISTGRSTTTTYYAFSKSTRGTLTSGPAVTGTTSPTSASTSLPPMPPMPYHTIALAGVSAATAGCAAFLLGIGGFVFLILAWRAIRAVPPAPVPLQPAVGAIGRVVPPESSG